MAQALTIAGRRLPLLLAVFWFAPCASAHRLDEYLQATLVTIATNSVRLQINLTPGVAVAGKILALIDHDHDGVISSNEAAAYADVVKSALTLRLDRRALKLQLTESFFPPVEELRSGLGIIQLEFSAAPGPITPGPHALAFENRHETLSSVYLINAALPTGSIIQITRQKRNDTQSAGEIEFIARPAANVAAGKRFTARFAFFMLVVLGGLILWWPRSPVKATELGSDAGK